MARVKNHDFFWRTVFWLCNLIAHNCNMSTTGKKDHPPSACAIANVGRPPTQFTVEDAVKLVSFSFPAVPAKLPL